MNLVTAIKEIEKEIMAKEQMHKNEMKELYSALKFLRKNNTSCEKCNGIGKVYRRPYNYNIQDKGDGKIHMDYEEELVCNACNGTGKKDFD